MNLLEFLVATAEERRTSDADADSLKYTAGLKPATWMGGRNGQWFVKVDGKEHALYDYWGSQSLPKGARVMVRYANGKYIAAW